MLETFKKKKLKTSRNSAQNEILQCTDFKRRWFDLIIVFTKLLKPNTEKVKNIPKYTVTIYFVSMF